MEALTRNASAISRALCSVLQHTDKTQDIDPAHTVLYFKGRTEVMCVEEALASQAHSENLCVFSCVRLCATVALVMTPIDRQKAPV